MCELIDTTISAAVQHSLNNLKSDCEKVVAGLVAAEAIDVKSNSANSSRRAVKAVLFSVCFLFSLVVPVCIALYKLETVFHALTQLKGDDPDSWVRRPRTLATSPPSDTYSILTSASCVRAHAGRCHRGTNDESCRALPNLVQG